MKTYRRPGSTKPSDDQEIRLSESQWPTMSAFEVDGVINRCYLARLAQAWAAVPTCTPQHWSVLIAATSIRLGFTAFDWQVADQL